MQISNPDSLKDFQGWLRMQVPFGVALTLGGVLGVQFAPSPLLAAVTTLVFGLLGLGSGIALLQWRQETPSEAIRS